MTLTLNRPGSPPQLEYVLLAHLTFRLGSWAASLAPLHSWLRSLSELPFWEGGGHLPGILLVCDRIEGLVASGWLCPLWEVWPDDFSSAQSTAWFSRRLLNSIPRDEHTLLSRIVTKFRWGWRLKHHSCLCIYMLHSLFLLLEYPHLPSKAWLIGLVIINC